MVKITSAYVLSSFLLGQCPSLQADVPLAVVEEILLNLPAHQVVRVCRLVCHEWKELVDSAAHWRVRCRREGIQPRDASRPPDDWRLFYFLTKNRRNLLKSRWMNFKAGILYRMWITAGLHMNIDVVLNFWTTRLCWKQQLIDLKKEGYSAAFMDQLQQSYMASVERHEYK
ncbi:F-box only protein 6-like [Onychostoma macrolepis]|uniref:F-box only protein 6-like n=1 Tax=Onychostoma macrolepis TaxID=369639 RepID=UPI00272B4BC0|nr:F-box only protein 6-like [Onychostoma macrolepis]